MVTIFLDYAAAFDTLSHKYLDAAMERAGASAKSRAICRAMYTAATAVVRVQDASGTKTYSERIAVDRGVIQGDVFSPRAFIIGLQSLMMDHDSGNPQSAALYTPI